MDMPTRHDHAGHDHGPKAAAAKRDDSGHGSPGHVHDDPADRGKRWYQTAKGKLVIFTALLLGAAWIIEYLQPEFGKWAFIAACLIGVAPVAKRAFAALRMGQPFTIESLMTIAAIGALPGLSNAYVSTGHGMLGVTLAAGSALALTDLVLHGVRRPVLAPFDPARF